MTVAGAPRTGPLGAGETFGIVVLLVLYSQALIPMLLATPTNPDSPVLRLLWLPIYFSVLVLAMFSIRSVLRQAFHVPFIMLLGLLVVASAAWSIDPAVTVRRSIAIVMTSLFGLTLAARYGWLNFLRMLGLCWLILAVGSFLAGAFVPSIGRMSEIHVGAWQGLWWEKNTLGGFMSRATLLFAVLALGDPEWRKRWIFAFLVAMALVLLSTSKTALLGTMLGLGVVATGLLMRRGPGWALATVWAAVLVVAALVAVLLLAPDLIFGLLGRDASLTGRTQIWEALGYVIEQRPWLGYGYGAFWEPGSAPGEWVRAFVEWEAPTAHNGWLEVCLSVGYVGVAFFALSFLGVTVRAVGTFARSWGGLYTCGFLAQFLLFSVSESIILQQNSLLWVTYVAVAAKLANPQRARSGSTGAASGSDLTGLRAARP